MTPERYQQITRLHQAALELTPSQCAAFLEQACAGDEELRREVESLLAHDVEADGFLGAPALDVAAQMLARERQPLAAGQRLRQYEVLSLLGAGGMGEVYLVEDTRLKRKVALKLLPAAFTQDAERVQRFEQEAQAASALNHPNLLTIHDFGQTAVGGGGLHYIASEYVEGQTLRQRLQAGALPAAQVVEIATQLADALSAAHQAGIIHRDIKPENLMLRPDGYVKVLDFGLAKLSQREDSSLPHHASPITHHSLTEPGKVMGTISYMSPEQALGQRVDARTDIFSLGVVLYELLSGVQPFKFESEAATYNAILNRTPPALTPVQAPPELAAIIERALEKDPDLRYQTAADLRAALKRLQRDSASHGAAPAPATRTVFPWRRVLSAVVLCGLVGLVLFLWRERRAAPPAPEAPRAVVSALPGRVSFNQQTEQAGVEHFPTLSPDGRTLVYASQESGNWDVWQQTVGQRDRVNLTADWTGDDTQPAFAPDGQRLAFRSSREGGGLFVLELASRAVKKIVSEGFNPTWSADGAEFAYGTVSVTSTEGRAKSQLWAVRVATGEKRLVTRQDAAQPAWSPHGQRLAFWSDRGHLWTISASGGEPVNVTNEAALDWSPCWSADGKYLYFISDRSGSSNLWRIAVDEPSGQVLGPPEPATTPASEMLHLSVARVGGQLAYVQNTKQRRLQSLPFEAASATVRGAPGFITQGTGFATHPSLSPDGQWLAYSSSGSSQEDIFIIRTDGTGLRQLTNDAAKDRVPRWSPDGRRIAFYSDRAGKNEIWAVAPDGTDTPIQLTFVNQGRAVFPAWSPDGNLLTYYLYQQGSFLFDLRTPWQQQTPQPIGLAGQLEADFAVWDWAPDGKKLAGFKFRASNQQTSIMVCWLAQPESASRLESVVERGEYPGWLSDSQRLLFTLAGKLYLTDLQTRATRQLFAPRLNEAIEYPLAARDGRTIYYSLASTEADIWLMNWQ